MSCSLFFNAQTSRPTKHGKTGKSENQEKNGGSPCLQSKEPSSGQILYFQTIVLHKENSKKNRSICLHRIKSNSSYVNPLGKQVFVQTILLKLISDHLLGKFSYSLRTQEYPKCLSLDHTLLYPLFQQEERLKKAFQAQAMHPCLMQTSNTGRPSDWQIMPHLSSTHYSRMRDHQIKLNICLLQGCP